MVNTQKTCTADRNTGVGSCSTHRPADEEHRDGPHQRYVSDQRLQDHAQLPVQLRKTESWNDDGIVRLACLVICFRTWTPFTPALQKYFLISTFISTSPAYLQAEERLIADKSLIKSR